MFFRRRERSTSVQDLSKEPFMLIGEPARHVTGPPLSPGQFKVPLLRDGGFSAFSESITERLPGGLDDLVRDDGDQERRKIRGKIFSNLTFDGLDITRFDFEGCIFKECHFIYCYLNQSNLTDCTMLNCSFTLGAITICKVVDCLLFETEFQGMLLERADLASQGNRLIDVTFRPVLLAREEGLDERLRNYARPLTLSGSPWPAGKKEDTQKIEVIALSCVVKGMLDLRHAFLMRVHFEGITHDRGALWLGQGVTAFSQFTEAYRRFCFPTSALRQQTDSLMLDPAFYETDTQGRLNACTIKSSLDGLDLTGATAIGVSIDLSVASMHAEELRALGCRLTVAAREVSFDEATLARCEIQLKLDAESRLSLARCVAGRTAADQAMNRRFMRDDLRAAFKGCSDALEAALRSNGSSEASIRNELNGVDITILTAQVSEFLEEQGHSSIRWTGLPADPAQYLLPANADLSVLNRRQPIADAINSHFELVRNAFKVCAEEADLSGVDLTGNCFVLAHCVGANFSDAVLEQSDFTAAALCDRARYARLRRANLSQSSFVSALLVRADFQDAVLFGARFYRNNGRRPEVALVRGANFAGVTGLTGTAFANLDMTDAKLPDRYGEGSLSSIETVSIQCRNLLAMALLAAAYVFLTVFNINEDESIREINLPVLEVAVPATSFTLTAAVLLLSIYAYLHTKLRTVWGELRRLPARFPDGRPAGRHIYPFIVTALATPVRGQAGRVAGGRFRISSLVGTTFEVVGAIFAGWLLVPIILATLLYFEIRKGGGDVASGDVDAAVSWPLLETGILAVSIGVLIWSAWVLVSELRSR